MPNPPQSVSDFTLYLLRALEAGADLRVRWRYGVPTATLDDFTLQPAEYFAFAADLSTWEETTGLIDGQPLKYTVQRWSLVEERQIADNDDFTEMQFVLTDDGRRWLADHPAALNAD